MVTVEIHAASSRSKSLGSSRASVKPSCSPYPCPKGRITFSTGMTVWSTRLVIMEDSIRLDASFSRNRGAQGEAFHCDAQQRLREPMKLVFLAIPRCRHPQRHLPRIRVSYCMKAVTTNKLATCTVATTVRSNVRAANFATRSPRTYLIPSSIGVARGEVKLCPRQSSTLAHRFLEYC